MYQHFCKAHCSNMHSRATDLTVESHSLWQGLPGFEGQWLADKAHPNYKSLIEIIWHRLLQLPVFTRGVSFKRHSSTSMLFQTASKFATAKIYPNVILI